MLRSHRSRSWLAALLLLACTGPAGKGLDESSAEAPSLAADTIEWITIYDPDRARNGYTLAFYAHRIPILLDMNGRIVHRWPEARVKSRLRLLPDGSLLGIALGRGVVEYDWAGNHTWEYVSELGFAHHDVIRLDNGNTVTLIRPDKGRFDVVIEVDRAGEVVWQWDSEEALRPLVRAEGWAKVDVTHLNSIQALPENRWFDSGDTRFRPGNYLMSSREMNLVFIVDRASQQVVWTHSTGLDKQHEPLMMGPEHPRAGNIVIFNNRYRSFYEDRQSTLLEIDPAAGRVVWQFRTAGFFSPTSGVVQPLGNGNLLVTSSRGARTFEIDRGGRIVWQWSPPFDTTRSHRYPFDWTPQLASLEPPSPRAVDPAVGYRHIDTDVYRFTRRGLRRKVRVAGKHREVLKYINDCRRMVLPADAVMEVEYGIDSERAEAARALPIRFTVDLRPLGVGDSTLLFDDRIEAAEEPWRRRTVELGNATWRAARLCLQTGSLASSAPTIDQLAFWQQPVILQPETGRLSESDLDTAPLTEEELETRKKHLEALGYIN